MGKDYRDLFEEGIVRLQEKMAALDPTSDEYRKANESLVSQLRVKAEMEKNEAEVKLKERHEENEEITTEREYEETLKKNHNDLKTTLLKLGVEAAIFAAGMAFNGFWGGRYWAMEHVFNETPSSGGMREFFKNHTWVRTK